MMQQTLPYGLQAWLCARSALWEPKSSIAHLPRTSSSSSGSTVAYCLHQPLKLASP